MRFYGSSSTTATTATNTGSSRKQPLCLPPAHATAAARAFREDAS
jgi:hypothetical protein